MEAWKIIFPSKWVICRFQPLIFQGVSTISFRGARLLVACKGGSANEITEGLKPRREYGR